MIQVLIVTAAAYATLSGAEHFFGKAFAMGIAVGGMIVCVLMLALADDKPKEPSP